MSPGKVLLSEVNFNNGDSDAPMNHSVLESNTSGEMSLFFIALEPEGRSHNSDKNESFFAGSQAEIEDVKEEEEVKASPLQQKPIIEEECDEFDDYWDVLEVADEDVEPI